MDNLTYQIKWSDTILSDLVRVRGTFDIHAQEMLGALIAVRLWAHTLQGQCVALYNDNPGAAGAIITKAPPLHRLDMQYMIRELAKLAVKYHFYFWGIKIDGANNDKADALSRFYDLKQFDVDESKCNMSSFGETQKVTNEYMSELIQYRKNVHPSEKKWNMYAIEEMKKQRTLKLQNNVACNWNIVQNVDDEVG